jgi:hypothetical protein
MVGLRGLTAVALLAGLSACATTTDPFSAQRSISGSPYSALAFDTGPIAPVCEKGEYRDNACWIDGVAYPTSNGRYARLPDGSIVRLNRNERRWERERWEAIQSRKDVLESLKNGTPIPPDSPALPENQSRPVPPPKTGNTPN